MLFQHEGKTVILRGVNLADGKMPRGCPSYDVKFLNEDAKCSYVNSPFSLEEAPAHLRKLRDLGFNTLRIPVVWEALEHQGPGLYDLDYIKYVKALSQISVEHGFKVIINPHQDLWSRFSGGSGAPLWTIHACGLNPTYFAETHACIRYGEWPLDNERRDPKEIPAMMWTTNHNRLATSTLFALFFAGRVFAPKCEIDGLNIQDYLQNHYFAAYDRLAQELGSLPYAFDGMNEPEPGYIGLKDLDRIEREDTAKIGSTPTPIQSMRLGMGISQTVGDYKLGATGPHKAGTVSINPEHSCWLKEEDKRWAWKRATSWPLGICVWALHGVWDHETGELVNASYFDTFMPKCRSLAELDTDTCEESFTSSYWQDFYIQWLQTIRQRSATILVLLQPPIFTPPPPRRDLNTGYSPHFYDALTIMRRHWHRRWNVDIVGLLRGNYKTKVSGLRIGKGNVKNVISDEIAQLSRDIDIPVIIGETGIPFNLDNSKAYSNGDYSDQVEAMDAILSGCDEHLLSYTLWAYSAINNHEWGDQWNGEDLSIYCSGTNSFPKHQFLEGFRAAAAWCRPYAQVVTGSPKSMSFDYNTSEFAFEVESDSVGSANIYVPWLHYRLSTGSSELHVEVDISTGEWSLSGQILEWRYERGGELKLRRQGGSLTPEDLGIVIV